MAAIDLGKTLLFASSFYWSRGKVLCKLVAEYNKRLAAHRYVLEKEI